MNYTMQNLRDRLPNEALAYFDETFTGAQLRVLYEGMRRERTSSFRVNLLKTDHVQVVNSLRRDGVKFKEFAPIKFAYQLQSKEKDLKKSELYQEGALYLQGLSGMLAPLWLDPKPGERVLDVAAAPGSKTTMLAGMMNNEGHIDALEPDSIRISRLKHNCDILGVKNTEFHQTLAQKFAPLDEAGAPILYDKILADVPCSGEGRFNLYDGPSYLRYRAGEVPKFARLQKKILLHAASLLAPGGRMVYSTCTLNRQENEEVLRELIENSDGEFRCLPPPVSQSDIDIMPEFLEVKQKGGIHALRILPSERFEGFFLALIERRS